VPLAEFVIAVLLIIPRSRLQGLYGAFGLMILFTGYILAITRYTTNVPCSCGGVLEKMSWSQHLIFNVVFIVAAGTAIMIYPFGSVEPEKKLKEKHNPGFKRPGHEQY